MSKATNVVNGSPIIQVRYQETVEFNLPVMKGQFQGFVTTCECCLQRQEFTFLHSVQLLDFEFLHPNAPIFVCTFQTVPEIQKNFTNNSFPH